MTETNHTCPRRAETGHDNPDSPFHGSGTHLDTWRIDGGLVTQGSVGLSCSYCGSLNPDRFMQLAREGWVVEPTDKNYKAYLGKPLSDEEKAERKAKWLESMTSDGVDESARERGETPEQFRAALADYYDRDLAGRESAGMQAKFYFQHLSAEQRHEFIELHNSRQMRVAGGGFYVRPFFTGPTA